MKDFLKIIAINLEDVDTQIIKNEQLVLLEAFQDREDRFKSFVDFITNFCASQYNLAGYKNQKYNSRFHHTVNESREQLRFIRAEVSVSQY